MKDVPPGEQESVPVLRAWRGGMEPPSARRGVVGLVTGRELIGVPGASEPRKP